MANSDGQQPWLSYDCTQGVCKPFCPQWCFSIFPPPPPLGFSDDSSGPSLSPLVIALIGILASAFLLVTYYVLISRYCGGFDSLRRRMGGGGGGRHDGAGATAGAAEGSGRFRGDQWQAPPPAGGLEEWVIRSIAVCRYKRGDGLVEGTDCSVCLCEFRDGESLRLLPDCCHAFHLPCIDTWLKSHSNCPLCRANIVYTFTSPSPSPPPRPPPPPPLPPRATTAPPSPPPLPESRHHAALAHDAERGGEREERRGVEGGGVSARKDQPFRIPRDSGVPDGSRHGIVELTEEGLPPAGRSLEGRVSPANTLRAGSEGGDFPVEEVGSSRGFMAEQHACKVGNGIRVLHCVVNPVPTRPFVGGRFCFTGQGKGGSHGSILPL